jgi:hypothetical protein
VRSITRLQNRMLQRRTLLRRHVLPALGLDLTVGRGLALGLTLLLAWPWAAFWLAFGFPSWALADLLCWPVDLLSALLSALALALSCVRCVSSRSDLLCPAAWSLSF